MGAGASAQLSNELYEILNLDERTYYGNEYDRLVGAGESHENAILLLRVQKSTWVNELQNEVQKSIKAVRDSPEVVISRLKGKIKNFKGKEYNDPRAGSIVKVTKEGRGAVDDALRYIAKWKEEGVTTGSSATSSSIPGIAVTSSQDSQQGSEERPMGSPSNSNSNSNSNSPISALVVAAEDHCCDIGSSGSVSHTGRDGSVPADRISRYTHWECACSECIWYGNLNPQISVANVAQGIVDDLIVDDGVPSRGHRIVVFDLRLRLMGVAVGSHVTFGHVTVITFAVSVWDDDLTSTQYAQRLATGTPVYTTATLTDKQKNTHTQWKDIGVCASCHEQIRGGRVVEVPNKRTGRPSKWHENCFCCGMCEQSLRGLPFKELPKDGGAVPAKELIMCNPCWNTKFAPICDVCKSRIIEGKTVKLNQITMHETCYVLEKARHEEVSSSVANGDTATGATAVGSSTKQLKSKRVTIKKEGKGGKPQPTAAGKGGGKSSSNDGKSTRSLLGAHTDLVSAIHDYDSL